jgi:hypothetical protein
VEAEERRGERKVPKEDTGAGVLLYGVGVERDQWTERSTVEGAKRRRYVGE